MRRQRQKREALLEALSPVDTGWRDAHANAVITRLQSIPAKAHYTRADLVKLFDIDHVPDNVKPKDYFEVGFTVAQLFLDKSRDELKGAMREALGQAAGVTVLKQRPDAFYGALEDLDILDQMATIINTPVKWTDILTERLKGGRGSAIKGQRRGRFLEDFVEDLVVAIFGEGHYDARCKFTGATGLSSEKCDFAIPNKKDPVILIEAKAYGATGSKQSDVLGDISRIGAEKRNDTTFLLVTDGITWRDRQADLARLVELQNLGLIYRIYTQTMRDHLEADLRQLKAEHGL